MAACRLRTLRCYICPRRTRFLQLQTIRATNKIQSSARYDLVLMDIIMPNLGGVSACHFIRQFNSVPIIAMTSNIRRRLQPSFQYDQGPSYSWLCYPLPLFLKQKDLRPSRNAQFLGLYLHPAIAILMRERLQKISSSRNLTSCRKLLLDDFSLGAACI